MAETDGSGNHEERIGKLETARREMEDALVVMAHLETKSAARIKEHAQFIADHQAAMKSFDRNLQSHAASMLEFDGKLNALIDIVSRIQGGIELQS